MVQKLTNKFSVTQLLEVFPSEFVQQIISRFLIQS